MDHHYYYHLLWLVLYENVCIEREVAQLCLTLRPHEQARLSREFSSQEYWSG